MIRLSFSLLVLLFGVAFQAMLAKVYNVQCLDGGSCVVKINMRDERTFRGMMDEGLGGYWKDKVSVNDGHDCLGA